jgi:hypothetical protein
MKRYIWEEERYDGKEYVGWDIIHESGNSGSGQTYHAPLELPHSQQEDIFTSASGPASLSPNDSSCENNTSIPISEQLDPSLNPESPRGWEWKTKNGEILWYSAMPPDAVTAKQTTILVDRDPITGRIRLTPVFPAYLVNDSIRLDCEKRSNLIDTLTKNINTLNPAACQEVESTRQSGGQPRMGSAFLHQALNSLSDPCQMNLGGMRFRQALPGLDSNLGHHHSHYRETEATGSTRWSPHQALRDSNTVQRVFKHVKAANEKIEGLDCSDASGETEEME